MRSQRPCCWLPFEEHQRFVTTTCHSERSRKVGIMTVSRDTLDTFAALNDRYADEAEAFAQLDTFSELAYYSALLSRFAESTEGAEHAAPQDPSELTLGRWTRWMH